ncbi:putative pilus assembly protein FilE [Acinetobacter baylyi]|uniref:FilE n=1 Tax=Acinetobacter baylyi (strain ATCC 33305 / BD413 / ADP1) TaxID=62977 RepID=Q6Q282_ACIAD|nr:putative pilus assembly protein FilE [Acinetobacter baylyi]AAS90696.1 FilE [Acinetobacter baylyi] [Acinetobacter baylyi ADP1]ENV55821.1 hypothetical protein F952_00449 [Acinetobacter baylyi DSM 14961 = CIP 107474]UXJ57268.1 putative pilus assembly protein FilE [Acinetobacter baylyi]UXJ61233.1 putative pilus assembly protein FilE [Acinetobacter baylyi]
MQKRQLRLLGGLSVLGLCWSVTSMACAGDFFTIIGPDGRPLVIQRQSGSTEARKPTRPQNVTSATSNNSLPNVINSPKTTLPANSATKVVSSVSTTERPKNANLNQPAQSQATQQSDSVPQKNQPITQALPLNSQNAMTEKQNQDTLSGQAQTEAKAHLDGAVTDQGIQAKSSPYISTIDGEQYVNNEYLEEREFNLDGKKRFYMMPEGDIDPKTGIVRMQPIEREKGVSRSLLNQIFKPKSDPQTSQVLALAPTYFRMPKQQVVESLATACFDGKKIKDAKKFDTDKYISLWPRKPLKDTFDYEVVKLSAPLKQMKLSSYASTQENPRYYWPFVVFLDQQGCVIEGVSGYKNQEYAATRLQYASLEGVIRLPESTAYILMTPLASAMDVEDKSLTNQGQIKLTAIR